MVGKPRVAGISGFGINCELETMAVFEMQEHRRTGSMSTGWSVVK